MDTNQLIQTNTFSKGMDTDTSDLMLSSEAYRYAENLRYVADGNANSGELHLISGGVLVGNFKYDNNAIEIEKILSTATNRNHGAVVLVGKFPYNEEENAANIDPVINEKEDPSEQDSYTYTIKNFSLTVQSDAIEQHPYVVGSEYTVPIRLSVTLNSNVVSTVKFKIYFKFYGVEEFKDNTFEFTPTDSSVTKSIQYSINVPENAGNIEQCYLQVFKKNNPLDIVLYQPDEESTPIIVSDRLGSHPVNLPDLPIAIQYPSLIYNNEYTLFTVVYQRVLTAQQRRKITDLLELRGEEYHDIERGYQVYCYCVEGNHTRDEYRKEDGTIDIDRVINHPVGLPVDIDVTNVKLVNSYALDENRTTSGEVKVELDKLERVNGQVVSGDDFGSFRNKDYSILGDIILPQQIGEYAQTDVYNCTTVDGYPFPMKYTEGGTITRKNTTSGDDAAQEDVNTYHIRFLDYRVLDESYEDKATTHTNPILWYQFSNGTDTSSLIAVADSTIEIPINIVEQGRTIETKTVGSTTQTWYKYHLKVKCTDDFYAKVGDPENFFFSSTDDEDLYVEYDYNTSLYEFDTTDNTYNFYFTKRPMTDLVEGGEETTLRLSRFLVPNQNSRELWFEWKVRIVADSANTKPYIDLDDTTPVNLEYEMRTGWAVYKFQSNEDGSITTPQIVFGPCFDPIADEYSHKVSTVLNYENDDVIKLYIADGQHPILIVNIAEQQTQEGYIIPTSISDIGGFSSQQVSAIKKDAIKIDSGLHQAGVVFYAYQLYTAKGGTSAISPVTNARAIFSDRYNGPTSFLLSGLPKLTTMAYKLVIDDDSKYNKIQVFRIKYWNSSSSWTCQVILDQVFDKHLEFIDYPLQSLKTYTSDEINRLFENPKVPQVITSKDNYLFAANIRDSQNALDDEFKYWDARSYSKGTTHNGVDVFADFTAKNDIFEDGNENSRLTENIKAHFASIGLSESIQNPNLSLLDSYDPSHWSFETQTWTDPEWVGIGPHVRWKFIIRKEIDHNDDLGPVLPFCNDIGVYYHNNLKEIVKQSVAERRKRSLRRDEIYRYGVILYNKNGSATDVKWIADIRTPDIYNSNLYTKTNDYSYRARPLGILFELTDLPTNCVGYEIVRVERSINDRATITLGIIGNVIKNGSDICSTGVPTLEKMAFVNTHIPMHPWNDGETHDPTGNNTLNILKNLSTTYYRVNYNIDNKLSDDILLTGLINTGVHSFPADPEGADESLTVTVDVNAISDINIVQLYSPEALYTPASLRTQLDASTYNLQIVGLENINIGSNDVPLNVHMYTGGNVGGSQIDVLYTKCQDKDDKNRPDLNIVRIGKVNKLNDNILKAHGTGFLSGSISNGLIFDESVARALYCDLLNELCNEYKESEVDLIDRHSVWYNWDLEVFSVLNYNKGAFDNFPFLSVYRYGDQHDMNYWLYASSSYNYQPYLLTPLTSSQREDITRTYSVKAHAVVDSVPSASNGIDSSKWNSEIQSVGGSIYHKYIYPGFLGNEYRADALEATYTVDEQAATGRLDKKHQNWDLLIDESVGHSYPAIMAKIGKSVTRFPGGIGIQSVLLLLEDATNSDGLLYKTYSGNYDGTNQRPTYTTYDVANNPSQINYRLHGRTLLCNVRKSSVIPYGGQTIQSIESSVYHKHGNYRSRNYQARNLIDVFDGDCFIGAMEITTKHKLYDEKYSNTYQASNISSVIVESDIDLDLTYGPTYTQYAFGENDWFKASWIQPNATAIVTPSGNTTSTIVFDLDLLPYRYNTAFDALSSGVRASAQISSTAEQELFDYRIFNSELKTANELKDSWASIYSYNYKDVDAKYGGITQMRTVGDKLLFWQEDAVGVLSVNERAQVVDASGMNLMLGSGGIAQRFDYITTQNGMHLHDMSEGVSNNTVYWYDRKRNNICRFGGNGFQQLSKTANVSNFLREKSLEASSATLDTVVDHAQNEILFNILHAGSLVFNEQTDRFTSVYTTAPIAYTEFYNQLYTIYNNNIERWNGNTKKGIAQANDNGLDPYIKYMVNKLPGEVKVYDNGELGAILARVEDMRIEFTSSLKQKASISGEREYDLKYDYYTSDFSDRENKYKFVIPREATANLSNDYYSNRLKGRTLTCELSSISSDLYFSLLYINTKYRISWS